MNKYRRKDIANVQFNLAMVIADIEKIAAECGDEKMATTLRRVTRDLRIADSYLDDARN